MPKDTPTKKRRSIVLGRLRFGQNLKQSLEKRIAQAEVNHGVPKIKSVFNIKTSEEKMKSRLDKVEAQLAKYSPNNVQIPPVPSMRNLLFKSKYILRQLKLKSWNDSEMRISIRALNAICYALDIYMANILKAALALLKQSDRKTLDTKDVAVAKDIVAMFQGPRWAPLMILTPPSTERKEKPKKDGEKKQEDGKGVKTKKKNVTKITPKTDAKGKAIKPKAGEIDVRLFRPYGEGGTMFLRRNNVKRAYKSSLVEIETCANHFLTETIYKAAKYAGTRKKCTISSTDILGALNTQNVKVA